MEDDKRVSKDEYNKTQADYYRERYHDDPDFKQARKDANKRAYLKRTKAKEAKAA